MEWEATEWEGRLRDIIIMSFIIPSHSIASHFMSSSYHHHHVIIMLETSHSIMSSSCYRHHHVITMEWEGMEWRGDDDMMMTVTWWWWHDDGEMMTWWLTDMMMTWWFTLRKPSHSHSIASHSMSSCHHQTIIIMSTCHHVIIIVMSSSGRSGWVYYGVGGFPYDFIMSSSCRDHHVIIMYFPPTP